MDKSGFVKILATSGDVMGNGFLLDHGLVATCAHVLRDALGIETRAFEPDAIKDREVCVEFHWAGGARVAGRVVPGGVVYDRKGQDLGLIRLSPPPEASALRLSRTRREAFPATSKPYFSSVDSSQLVAGKVVGRDENGKLTLKIDTSGGFAVEAGNSGGAVFLQDGELVEAMFTQRDAESNGATAFLMPADLIEKIVAKVNGATSANAPSTASQMGASGDRKALIDDLCGPDPVAGFAAIEPLAAFGPEFLKDLLNDRGMLIPQIRKRDLVAAIGDEALPVLADGLASTSITGKDLTAPTFEAFRGSSAATKVIWPLLQTLDVYTTRSAIVAAGYAGYAGTIPKDIANLAIYGVREPHFFSEPNPDDLSKLASDAITAISMGYGNKPWDFALEKIDEIGAACLDKGIFGRHPNASMALGYPHYTPEGLESLCTAYLSGGPDKKVRALDAIAKCRFSRFAMQAESMIRPTQAPEVREAAAHALAEIGDKRAANELQRTLMASDDGEFAWKALTTLFHLGDEWPENVDKLFGEAVFSNDYLGCSARVSAAMATNALGPEDAKYLFESRNSGIGRGSGGLAYAIVDKPGARKALAGCHEEATDGAEEVLLLCAQIVAGDHAQSDSLHARLQEPLPSGWNFHEGDAIWRHIVLACLAEADPTGKKAAAWGREWRCDSLASTRQIAGLREHMFFP